MTGYELSRQWWNFSFENQDLVSSKHCALYMWIIEKNNRLGWVEKFGFPMDEAGAAIGIKKIQTVREALNDLESWGFVRFIVRSPNQYKANVISIVNCQVKSGDSLDQAICLTENRSTIGLATGQANGQPRVEHEVSQGLSTVPIDKPLNNQTNKPLNQQTDVDADRVGSGGDVENSDLKEKKETPPKVAPKGSPTVHARIREIIQTENKGYYWQGKDGTATKSIIKKITFRWGEKNGSDPTEDQIVESFIWLVKNLPEWYKNKWDACLIESKFESIVKEIHEQKNGNKQNGNSYGQPGANGVSPRFAEAWELLDKSRGRVPT